MQLNVKEIDTLEELEEYIRFLDTLIVGYLTDQIDEEYLRKYETQLETYEEVVEKYEFLKALSEA
jgi:hypothetical protein